VVHLPSNSVRSVADVIGLSPEIMDKPIGRLSGGQFQKALIAFALLGDPNVLLLDEPTASLDQLTEERVYELIRRLQKTFGLTLIIVSHDLSMVYREATQVLCINRQGLCFVPPSKVLTPETLQALYGEHLHFYQHPHDP